jgi:hypothetical protein
MSQNQPWKQWDVPTGLQAGGSRFPVIQWENQPRRLTIDGGWNSDAYRNTIGDLGLPLEDVAPAVLDGDQPAAGGFFVEDDLGLDWPAATLSVGPKDVEGFYSPILHMAVAGYLKLWETREAYPQVSTTYQAGMRSRLRLLGFAIENGEAIGPVTFTARGMANQPIAEDGGWPTHVANAKSLGGEPFMFSFVMVAGRVTMMGSGSQQSTGTPIQCVPVPSNADAAASRYVGNALVERIIGMANVIRDWKDHYIAGGNGDPHHAGDSDDASGPSDAIAWARNTPLPARSQRYPKGTPLGTIIDEDPDYARRVLGYLVDGGPDDDARKAALALLPTLQQAPADGDLPF